MTKLLGSFFVILMLVMGFSAPVHGDGASKGASIAHINPWVRIVEFDASNPKERSYLTVKEYRITNLTSELLVLRIYVKSSGTQTGVSVCELWNGAVWYEVCISGGSFDLSMEGIQKDKFMEVRVAVSPVWVLDVVKTEFCIVTKGGCTKVFAVSAMK